MLIRRESAAQADIIRSVTGAAFARPDAPGRETVEARLVDELRILRLGGFTRGDVGSVIVLVSAS